MSSPFPINKKGKTMGAVPDYLNSLGVGEDGATMYPDTLITDIQGAYDSDLQGATAQVSLLAQEIEQLKAQNLQLAAANWNLLQSQPVTGEVTDDPASEDPEDDADDDTDDDPDTDDFFTKKEDK